MKNLLYVLTAFLIFSCSPSDGGAGSSSSDLNPPSWIQGTWKQDNVGVGINNSFIFSTNDMCSNIMGAQQCQQGLIDFARKGGMTVNVVESITNTFYSAEIKYSNGQSTTYAFNKISNTEIEFEAVSGEVFVKQ
jgi:hypothetical protein